MVGRISQQITEFAKQLLAFTQLAPPTKSTNLLYFSTLLGSVMINGDFSCTVQ